ncbi:MAG: NUDIX domain-containing protein [Actinobacteria bacterium]|nr:NUDIX domain-containing protein [Actinomycetota bacterium]
MEIFSKYQKMEKENDHKVQIEQFEIFDEKENLIGTAPRPEVHKNGYFHRATNIFVLNPKGELLIQKRAANKDICPSLWDLSCAEHLKCGETYKDAAIRGLKEELNIDIKESDLVPLCDPILNKYEHPEKGIQGTVCRIQN